MATIWERLYPLLSEEKREEWAKRFKKRFGKDFIPPKQPIQKDKQAIICETKMESIEEIDKFMRQKPNPTERK